jgi:diguanylate cyclase (GGDEF)-like protein
MSSDRRRDIWSVVVGPSLTLATAGVLLLLAHAGIKIPVPAAFLILMIVLSSYFGGAIAGYLSAAAALAVHPVLLSEPGLIFMPDPATRLQATAVVVLIVPILTIVVRNRIAARLESERGMRERAEAANRELLVLRAELVRHAQELERLATTDDLTGLCNRRHFLALARDLLTQDERRRRAEMQQPLALLVLDIDHFKSVNDRFGHDGGDAVIRHVADVCRSTISDTDILARFGGEEFVLLLPQTTGEQAAARAEAMRRKLESSPLQLDRGAVRVTISVGVAEAGADMQLIGDLMKRADEALYQAKRDGRNRVHHASRAASRPGQLAAASAAA